MLVTVQWPFTDARVFLTDNNGKLIKPAFPLAEAGQDFLRNTGQVRERRRGGATHWFGEEVYCEARNALRLPTDLGNRLGAYSGNWSCAFRRYLCQGGPASRVELGLTASPKSKQDGSDNIALRQLLAQLAHLPVRVGPSLPGRLQQNDLLGAGKSLASHLASATTSQALGGVNRAWWLTTELPVVVFEFDRGQVTDGLGREIQPSPASNISVRHATFEYASRLIPVWSIVQKTKRGQPTVRDLRIHILRLHSEQQTLFRVLRHIAHRSIEVQRGTEAAEKLQWYLNDGIRWLQRPSRGGFEQGALLEAAYVGIDRMSEHLRATLIQQLREVRPNVARKVEDITARPAIESPTIILSQGGVSVGEQINVTAYGDIVGSNIGRDNVIADSVAIINRSEADSEVKEALLELQASVEAVMRDHEGEQAGAQPTLQEDFERLRDEALRQQPRFDRLRRLARSLGEAAEELGAVALPIAKGLSKLMSLFA